MKNHRIVNGKLLQTNKKWSHLSQKQKNWICEVTQKAHADYILKHNKLPISKKKYEIFDKIQDKVNEREIWIPFHELKTHVNTMLDRLNRKSPLFGNQKKENPENTVQE